MSGALLLRPRTARAGAIHRAAGGGAGRARPGRQIPGGKAPREKEEQPLGGVMRRIMKAMKV